MLSLFQGIKPVKRAGAVRDALAGVVFAAMDIPQVLGYTRIAGMPVVTGLYALLLPLLAFATFGSSRYLVVAADSATAAILRSGINSMAPAASARYVALASLVALLTAGFLLLARLFKLGFIADFLPQTVLIGFLTGVGFQVGVSVLGQMLGIPTDAHKPILQLYEVCRALPHIHPQTLLVTSVCLATILLLRRFAPHWQDVPPLVSVATSCTVMILTQSAATSRIYAGRHRRRLDADQDIVGLSAANAAAAFSGTFVVNGSPTQTAMLESCRARSQFAQVTTAAVVALVLLFLTRPIQYLPHCVLGALVFLVALRLIDLRALQAILPESRPEYALALTTAVFVVLAGVEQGIVLAMVMSLLRIVHHSYHPRSGVMIPEGDGTWKLIPPVTGAATEPGLVLYRFGAALFYANASRFADEISTLVGPSPTSVRWLIVDAEAITNVDYTAARVVQELKKDLTNAGVVFGFARVAWNTRADFDRHHLTEAIGPSLIFNRLHDAVDAYEKLSKKLNTDLHR